MVETNYTITSNNQTYTGLCEVPKRIWELSRRHWNSEIIHSLFDPVLEEVIKKEKLSVEISEVSYDNIYPTKKELQKDFLGGYFDDVGNWVRCSGYFDEDKNWIWRN